MLSAFYFFDTSLHALESIYLKGKVFTQKKEVYLSDIAKISDSVKDRIIFQDLSDPTILRPEDLQSRLSDVSVSGKETIVIPLNSELDPSDLEESLLKEISKLPQGETSEFKITYMSGDRAVPEKGVDLKWAGLPRVIHAGQIVASLDYYFQNRKVHTQRIKFKIDKRAEAFFAKRAIRKGERLTEDSIEKREVYLEEPFQDGIGPESIGWTALVDLSAGELLRKKHVRFLYDVQRGGDVNLVYISGNLVVKARSKALSSGNIGDKVEVTAHSKDGRLTARVVEKNTVLLEN
ncbi:flagella basal body P-ring formation protein FlgA [Leptospira perolatii]|uniref:Flagella basal body P-ring formation protein FlgA n=1 Tax=Leptospira perolatii TaxID=2023191 RepID=A0A2M9ZQW7_9LEPT|nr:flagella basal body P-ring formation protein FlgA [Leptospira perolatii]PJZ74468.1 flagella basal body P-ring formation protein FlgA [Leptospira perolatii]